MSTADISPSASAVPAAGATIGGRLVVLVLLAAYATLVLRTGWIGDDAYIAFRTSQNLVEGHGLTWNPDERVQAFTSPLWTLLAAGAYALTHEMFRTMLIGSALISIAAAALLALVVIHGTPARVMTLVVLTVSKSYVDYSTSGLENPLIHLLIVLLAWRLSRGAADARGDWSLGLLLCGLGLTRLDLLLLGGPLGWLVLRRRGVRGLIPIGIALLPLAAWLAWSTFYYGTPLPNTAYAKLNNGVPRMDLIWQGSLYCIDLLRRDPVATGFILTGLLSLGLPRCGARTDASRTLAAGAVLYVLYAIWIGGDFMAGRLFAAPLLLCVSALALLPDMRAVHHLVLATVAAVFGVASPNCPIYSFEDYGVGRNYVEQSGIADERAFYYRFASLPQYLRAPEQPDHDFVAAGRAAARDGVRVMVHENIGYLGYFAGPSVHIIDRYALADPLLARLRPIPIRNWRIGHFKRAIPAGYEASLLTGQNQITDPDLAEYYKALRYVIAGPLWNWDRMRAIWTLHTSAATHLRKYESRASAATDGRSAAGGSGV